MKKLKKSLPNIMHFDGKMLVLADVNIYLRQNNPSSEYCAFLLNSLDMNQFINQATQIKKT